MEVGTLWRSLWVKSFNTDSYAYLGLVPPPSLGRGFDSAAQICLSIFYLF
jgi:hypothetical protein